jgi:WD40 repeat protein
MQAVKRRRLTPSTTRLLSRARAWLLGGPLHVLDIWDIIAIYAQALEGTCTHILDHSKSVGCLASLPGGKIASGSADNTVRVWKDGTRLHTLTGHTSRVKALAVLPDGKLASGSWDKTVRVWC